MLALSIKQPWTDALAKGQKSIEVRKWAQSQVESARKLVGRWVALHAGKQPDLGAPVYVGQRAFGNAMFSWVQVKAERCGGIVGIARLADLERFTPETWESKKADHLNPLTWWDEGLIGLHFALAARLDTIIRCPGQLGFFRLEDRTLAVLLRKLEGQGVRLD